MRAMARDAVTGRRPRTEKFPRTSWRQLRLQPLTASAELAGHRAEIHVFEIRLRRFKVGTRRPVAVDTHECTSGEELRGDHRVLPLQVRQIFFRDHSAPDATAEVGHRAQRLRLEENLSSVNDGRSRAQLAHILDDMRREENDTVLTE